MELQLIHFGAPMIYSCAREGNRQRWMFSYITEQDAIVMNKNHKNYEDYEELLLAYLSFDDLQRKEFLQIARSVGTTFFDSINKVLRIRKKIHSNKYKQKQRFVEKEVIRCQS